MAHLTEAAACDLVRAAFARVGVPEDMASDAAQMLVMAQMMGITTHGLARVVNYVDRIKAGGVDPAAKPQITVPAPGLRHVDGQNGLGAAVALRGMNAAMEAARDVGIGAAFCRRSSHQGALAPQLAVAAEQGFAAIFTTNTSPMIAPPGGRTAVIGNAPFGVALPDDSGTPVILDIAMSVAARSKVRKAAASGDPIPDTWATDADGQPTTDAKAAMAGMMQAIGGRKGAHLALCLDLLAGGLSGAAMLSEVANANTSPGAVGNVGHMIIAIDAKRLIPPDALSGRLNDARGMLEGSALDAAIPPRLPGARAMAALRKARRDGFEIPAELQAELSALAG